MCCAVVDPEMADVRFNSRTFDEEDDDEDEDEGDGGAKPVLLSFPQARESLACDDQWGPPPVYGGDDRAAAYHYREDFLAKFGRSPDGCSSHASSVESPIYERLQPKAPDRCGHGLAAFFGSELRNRRRRLLVISLALLLAFVLLVVVVATAGHFAVAGRQAMELVRNGFILLGEDLEAGPGFYHFSEAAANFSGAVEACLDLGSHLAEPASRDEHLLLTRHLSKLAPKSGWWLAATDDHAASAGDGDFRWLSSGLGVGDGFASRNLEPPWAAGQPDNWPAQPGQPEEDCMAYMHNLEGLGQWKWNDLNCAASINYICKLR